MNKAELTFLLTYQKTLSPPPHVRAQLCTEGCVLGWFHMVSYQSSSPLQLMNQCCALILACICKFFKSSKSDMMQENAYEIIVSLSEAQQAFAWLNT